mgnify:FL=1
MTSGWIVKRNKHLLDKTAILSFLSTLAMSTIYSVLNDFHKKLFLEQGEDAKPEDLQQFYQDNLVPLVGQISKYNEEKRYSKKRPLCVAYYGVDFGFDNRVGKVIVQLLVLR